MGLFDIFKRKRKDLPVDEKSCGNNKKRMMLNRVINTLENGKFMAKVEDDGVYIRLAGNKDGCEAFSLHFANVLPNDNYTDC